MPQIRHPSFRDAHEDSKYPFEDRATLTNDSGDIIHENTFLGASIYPVGGTTGFYLSSIVVRTDSIRFVIGDSSNAEIASGSFNLGSPPSEIKLTDVYGRAAGLLVTEPLRAAVFQTWAVGTHNFTSDQTPFVAAVCIPMPEIGLRGVILEDGTLITGDIYLVGADGIVLRVSDTTLPPKVYGEPGRSVKDIRIDVIGDPLFRRRLCEDTFETPRFLQSLRFLFNGRDYTCGPGDHGDIKMLVESTTTGDTVLRLVTNTKGLTIETVGEQLIRD